MDKNKWIMIIVAVAIVVGGGAFYGGMQFAKMGAPARGQGAFAGAAGARSRGAAGTVGGFSNGSVISVDSGSVTIKLPAGGSKVAFFSSSTEVGKFVNGAISDLAAGENVMITGKANPDGSLTAQSIQIRPAAAAGAPGAGAPGAAPQTPPQQ